LPIRTQDGLPQPVSRAAFGFYMLMTLLIAGGLMGICYLALLEGWYGETATATSAPVVPPAWTGEFRAVVVSQACPGDEPDADLPLWRYILRRESIPFRVFNAVADVPESVSGALLLSRAQCLSPAEKQKIRSWLAQGGGVVATGALGARSEAGRGEDWSFLEELGGIRGRRQSFRPQAYITLGEYAPLGAGLAPGDSWLLRAGNWPVASADAAVAFWSDARLRPALEDDPAESAALVRAEWGRGRFVWLGPPASAFDASQKDGADFRTLLANALYWAARQPLASVAAWPQGQAAGVLVAQEIHSAAEVPDALAMARQLSAQNAPVTFFLSSSVENDPAVPRQLHESKNVELALWSQARPADGAMQAASSDSGALRGIRLERAPEEDYSLDALTQAGYAYLLSKHSPESAAPRSYHFRASRLFPLDHRTLVRLPQTGRRDLEILSGFAGAAEPARAVTTQLLEDFRRMKGMNGLHVLAYRTDLLGSAEMRPALLGAVQQIRREGAWLARASEIADWWVLREKIGVRVDALSSRRLRLSLAYSGDRDLEAVRIHVAPPFASQNIRVTPAVFGGQRVAFELKPSQEMLEIRIPKLKAQSVETWLIDLF